MEYLNIKRIVLALVLLVAAGNALMSQTKGMESLVDELVQEMPANTSQELGLLTAHFEETGRPGITHLLNGLSDGQTDDSNVRQAISALSKQASDGGNQALASAFLTYLQDSEKPLNAKGFLLGQLQFFADDGIAKAVAALIPQLCYPAVRVLSTIGTSAALEALATSSADVSDDCRASVIMALASHKSPHALTLAEAHLQSEHIGMQDAVRASLLTSSNNDTYELLVQRAKNGNESDQLTLLSWLDQAAASRQIENLRKTIATVLKAETSDQVKLSAMQVAARHLGNDASPLMRRSLQEASPALVTSLVGLLNNNKALELTPYLNMTKSIPLLGRMALVGVAGKRKDAAGLSLARELMEGFGMDARIAGIKALSEISGKAALPELVQMLAKATDQNEVNALLPQISRYLPGDDAAMLGEVLPTASPTGQQGILRLAKERSFADLFDQIKPLFASENAAVRTHAFQALPALTSGLTVEDIVPVFSDATNDDEQAQVAAALANYYNVEGQGPALVGRLISLFPEPAATPIVAKAMARTGDADALKFIEQRILTTGGYPNHARQALLEWDHPDAIDLLFDQVAMSDPMIKAKAAQRIIDLSGRHTPAQQLLILRKLLNRDLEEEMMSSIFRTLSRVANVSNLRYLSRYLDSPSLQESASSAIIGIALNLTDPDAYLGSEELAIVRKAREVLGEEIGYYTVDALQELLDNTQVDGGYMALFNGVNLDNWQGLVGSPLSRAKMTLEDRIRAQDSADFLMRESWIVQDGLIKFIGSGYDNLSSTVESYGDFELLLDWKIEKDGDSGIYLRGSPQVQMWDPDGENGGVGSGGLFNNKLNAAQPIVRADNPVGEWNTFRILMIDDRVTVFLNGTLVTDHAILENYWDRAQKLFPRGPIELQAHTTPLAFRDIYIRELPGAFLPEPLEQRDSFVALYNGLNLDGWIGNKSDYVSENGEIVIHPTLSGGSGNLFTKDEYENFVLRFDFKLTPGANNGLGIHAPLEGDAAYMGKELQILDNTAEKYAELKEYQYHGSVYGVAAAKRGFLKPVGEWNMQEVIVKDDLFVVRLNGETILEADLAVATQNGTLDGREHPGLAKKKGHIGFLGHGSEVRFRNIRIKVLE